ncbi:Chromosome segregation protein [Tenacibaculum dicentrarchi]|uniref:Chromosome segregation protein n=1 Tax=Tenacibaculum dicentrarchi TaxID=669041 RepID=A0ABM9NU64_9FLAO|nr:Chromosome segregation protein [Tenacibaculum dicentrarchi]
MLENNEKELQEPITEQVIAEKAETEKAVNEVEIEVANEAEKVDEKHEIPMLDYATMELSTLVDELNKLLRGYEIQQLKSNVDALKNAFNTKFSNLVAEKKEAFLAEGGNIIDFQFSSPVKADYNKLLTEYKIKRDAHYTKLENQLKENLEKRNSLIDELKTLIGKADAKTMYNEFQEIQKKWRTIGAVPKTKYNDTWKIYHHHVERFYDLLDLNKDFRELDFKHNLEEKLKIITRAKALNEVADVNVAFKDLQDLHRIWKEEIGPVGKEHREDVWGKFSEATKKIHDKRHQYFRELKSKYQEMIDAKLEVVAQINAFDTSNNNSHNDWQKSIIELEKLRKKYFDIGKLPYNKSEAVWQQFKSATKKFNSAKNVFYKAEKSTQNDNLKNKIALIELAESIKDSDDWENTTNTMKRIQSDWKKIGHVPRKFSDDIWKRFKDACNYYFDRLNTQKNEQNKEQLELVVAKKEFIEQLKTSEDLTLENLQERILQWRTLGSLPRNARHLDEKFNKAVDAHLGNLNMSKGDIELMKFKNSIDTYLSQKDFKKLDNEQYFIRKKIDENVREMQQLENNLGFFSNAKPDNPLVLNVRKGIQEFKDQLDIWKAKLNYIKKLDY